MVLDRRPALAGLLAGLLVAGTVAGCGGSTGSGTSRPSTSIATGATSADSSPADSSPSDGAAASPSHTISIPPYLCTGTDVAQNAADAYMGALSAGQLDQAMACVLPNTVPAAVTRSLLASSGQTAVYLPRDGVDGPSVFGYRGNGKLVDVTVSKEPDGRFWVTAVAVRSG
ncbi:hypothetical protein [Jatrophihabitans sp.]|uniref:hypothetical protein n=1 Tax=Jatrophihabitans sp. TaxID=1932789 RepID=UPI002CE66F53|nr:hypothetical protein [Jatrophihabitans sp.]